MALHEIELSDNYKINSNVFFDETKFNDLIKHNNLTWKKEDMDFLEEYYLKVDKYSFLHDKYHFLVNSDFKSLNKVILNPITIKYNTNTNVSLYSSWFLFYLALNKSSENKIYREDFIPHISNFKFIEEYRLKKYYIYFSYLNDKNRENLELVRTKLNNSLTKFVQKFYIDVNTIIVFLKFLLKLHEIFFNNEQYKIMWNLESIYIYEIINILMRNFSLEYKDIINKLDFKMGIGISKIDSIYIELPKYICDNKDYIIDKELTNSINNLFNTDLVEEELFLIIYKEEYFEIYNSIVELQKRIFSYNKRDNNLCLAILIGLVLSLEPKIKNFTKIESNELLSHLKSFDCLNNCVLGTYQYNEKKLFFDKLNILRKEKESIEKYLMIYRNSRNYLAHAKVNHLKLFNEDNYIKDIFNSILITIFFLIKRTS